MWLKLPFPPPLPSPADSIEMATSGSSELTSAPSNSTLSNGEQSGRYGAARAAPGRCADQLLRGPGCAAACRCTIAAAADMVKARVYHTPTWLVLCPLTLTLQATQNRVPQKHNTPSRPQWALW